MKEIVVDSSVWSLVVRRKPETLNEDETEVAEGLSHLLRTGYVVVLGPVRQELLSGIRRVEDWNRIASELSPLVYYLATLEDHDNAARFFNRCQRRGVAATPFDMLICAMATRLDATVFSVDEDFGRYASCLPIDLYRL